jgi:putative transposase
MQYRRAKVAGGTYFFTVVTHNRRPFLCELENIDLLRAAFRSVMIPNPVCKTINLALTPSPSVLIR